MWTGAVAVQSRGGFAAFGAWLRTPSGLLVWRQADRLGDVTEREGAERGIAAVARASRAHRAGHLALRALPLQARLEIGHVAAVPGEDSEALALAESVLPSPPQFAAAGLEYVEPGHFIAHGTQDYQVWTKLGVCSCPAFTFGASRPCKHLKAALTGEHQVG